jgi:hypothetical protein
MGDGVIGGAIQTVRTYERMQKNQGRHRQINALNWFYQIKLQHQRMPKDLDISDQ